jgi:tetratricopeptide (TPR) repeat protein
MKRPHHFFVVVLLLLMQGLALVAADSNRPPSYEEARAASWMLACILIEGLEQGDAKQFPGTHAWLKDLRTQTKGIDKNVPVTKWPKVDVGAFVDHNPNFWRMYFEVAPADPALTVIHAGLLLSQGEAKRAAYILELGRHRPGIPKEFMQGMQMLQNSAMAALQASDTLTEQGTKLFDKGDYDGAIAKFREAHSLCPTNGWTYYEMGYTVRTQAQVARGETPDKAITLRVNVESHDSPKVIGAFAEARRHDPLQIMAYQGSDQEVIKGFKALGKQVMPAWKALREPGITKEAEYKALQDLSEGLSEAGVHDLAIFARQLMASRRNSYDPTDYPIFVAGLRKLAPGAEIEQVLARLAGGKGKETLGFRSLTKLENEEGQPALGSGERLYMPDKPAPKNEANKPVQIGYIRLLTDADDVAKRTTVEDFSKFVQDFRKMAEEILGKSDMDCKILVQFKCSPSGHEIEFMHQPKEIDIKPLKELRDAVTKLDKLPVKDKTVEFQVQLTVTVKNKLPKQNK